MLSSRSEGVFVVALAALLASCSLGTVQRARCETHADCQAAFGFGSICVEDGLCRRAPPEPRCERTFPADLLTNPTQYRDTIVIGSIMDRSLDTQEARENAAQLAVASANGDGDDDGLDGRKFGVVFCTIEESNDLDSRTRQEAAVHTALYLARDLALPAIVGPSSSADVEAVFGEVEALGTLIMSPSATGASLTEIDVTEPTDVAPGHLWRTAPPDQVQARVIADDMASRSITRVAVIHASDAYGAGMATIFDEVFEGEAMLLPFTNDFAEPVVVAATADVQEILFISSQTEQAAAFVNATVGMSVAEDFDTKTIFLTDSAANSDFIDATMGSMERWPQIRGTRPNLPSGPVYDIFQTRYIMEFGEDPFSFSFAAHAYDATWLVLYGIAWAHYQENAINGTTIARGLRRVSSGTPFDIQASTFPPIVMAFQNGESVDVRGASGTIDYDPATEETRGGVEIWVVRDGQPVACTGSTC